MSEITIKMSAEDFAKFELLDIEFVELWRKMKRGPFAVRRKQTRIWLRTNPENFDVDYVRLFATPENNIEAVLRWATQLEYWY